MTALIFVYIFKEVACAHALIQGVSNYIVIDISARMHLWSGSRQKLA